MATVQENIILTDTVKQRLARLRRWIRCYVVVQGIAAATVVMAGGFWISLLLDWSLELSPFGRGVVLLMISLALVAALYRMVLSRLLIPLTDRNMAMLLERRHGSLDDRLVTVVELAGRSPQRQGYDPRMLAATRDELDELMPTTSPARVFNLGPLTVYATLAVVMTGSAGIRGLATRRDTHLGRPQSDVWRVAMAARYPNCRGGIRARRRGHRVVKVAKGSSLDVSAKADLLWETPESVEIHYAAEQGVTRRPKMTKLKDALRGRDAYQFYEYKFTNVQSTTVFSVIAKASGVFAKHDRIEDLVIQAVESPDLVDIQLECQCPEYLGKTAETFSVRLIRPIPEGTQVRIVAKANKDLRNASYRETLHDSNSPSKAIRIDPHEPRSVNVDLGPLSADARVVFQLTDTDNVVNQQPIRLLLRVTPDEQPRVEIDLAGIGKAVTPFADLPIRGTVSDDNTITQTWFEFSIDGDTARMLEFPTPDDGQFNDVADIVFQMAELGAQPGQRVSLSIKAADNYALKKQPQVGSSNRYDLRIVTESQLRAQLETRERMLRRRFEGVIVEMKRMHDSLDRMTDDQVLRSRSMDPDSGEGSDPDASPVASDDDSGRLSSVRTLRAETALETSGRMAHETAAVATEFDRILLELELNNVTFIDELRRRLGDGISSPLKDIVAQQFPRLDDRLRQLRQVLEDDQLRPAAITASLRQLDIVLIEMDQVLKNMLELQKFNELLADLRKIIDHQKQVSKSTERERKEIEKRRKEELKKGLLD